MQVVILAAGMGKRLRSKTKEHTKSMVEILGKTFLEHSLDNLTQFDISRIIIVIGYCGNEIQEVIGDSYNDVPVIYVENEVYATTNNIYSLYLANKFLEEEDTLLLESDLIYDKEIIARLIEHPYPNLAVVDKYKPYMDGTVVKVNEENQIKVFIDKKHFDYNEIDQYYKTVNIYKFSKEFLKDEYIPFLEAYCKVMGNSSYYELVLKVLLSLEKNNLQVLIVDDEKWYEVDDLQDYDIAECLFCKDDAVKLNSYSKRFGGYWRFDKLKDFCYLVNPYFPPKRMKEEMKYSFDALLEAYPSGQKIQKLLITNNFNLKSEMVLVGNGAAELINVLLPKISGNVGMILPTFQEYPSRLNKEATVHYYIPQNADFSYTLEDLITFADKIDTLVLINPDNPSGNFINKKNILSLLSHYSSLNKNIILDESFVDFSGDLDSNSLLDTEILEKYKNLIVIKSISKSYGVPGVRLGIMATSNENILLECQKDIPVWNINSYGEFFLQILSKYRGVYNEACQKIADNRNDFYNKLSNIPFIKPTKSQANYILCNVVGSYNSSTLTQKLLEHNILIKDCKNKMGFDNKSYVRIAVKSKEDNNLLIDILKTF